jgi:hypothetical protein
MSEEGYGSSPSLIKADDKVVSRRPRLSHDLISITMTISGRTQVRVSLTK